MGYRMAWLVKIYYLDFTEIRLIRICYLDFIKFDWDFVSLVSLCCNLHVVCMYFIFWIALYEIFYLDNYYEINIAYLRHDLVLVNLLCVICESRRVIYMDVWPKFYFIFFLSNPSSSPNPHQKILTHVRPTSLGLIGAWSNLSCFSLYDSSSPCKIFHISSIICERQELGFLLTLNTLRSSEMYALYLQKSS